ncbi:MAG: PKD domain-containing protein [Bacteroidales bacterium]|nr:PKD domain-containing protein [Bacteroidales bacterium]
MLNINGQASTTKGKEFWMGFMQNYDSTATLSLYITATVATSGTVSIPGLSWIQSFAVAANSITAIDIPFSAMAVANGLVENKGIRILANDTISVYALNYQPNTMDAAVIFPVNSLDKEYRVQTIKGWPNDWGVEYMIVATADSSVVEITPFGGSAYTVNMNAGQVFQVQSTNDLSGAKIKEIGSCSNIAVYVGNVCADIGGCVACDHLYEQLLPISRWGVNHITVPLMNKSKDYFNIIANENTTSVSINNGTPFNLNAGQIHMLDANQPQYISSTKPIQIIQYAQGGSCDGVGDPFSVVAPPIEQSIKNITFNAFTSSVITSYFVNIVTKTNSTGILTLDGLPITFTTVPDNTQYAYARVPITQGNHTILSDSGFTAMVYGYGAYKSYGYSAGFGLLNLVYDFIISNEDSICSTPGVVQYTVNTVCANEVLCFKTPIFYPDVVAYEWDFGDGNTASGAAVSHQYATPGTYTVILTLTDGCATTTIQKNIQVIQIDLNIIPSGPTTFCEGLSVDLDAGGIYSHYSWSTMTGTQSINVTTSGTYSVTVTDNNSCSGTASIDVTVNPLPTVDVTPDQTICNGDTAILVVTGLLGSTYQWSTGETNDTIYVSPSSTNIYAVIISNVCGSVSDTIVVSINSIPSVIVGPDTICAGELYPVNASITADTILWLSSGTGTFSDTTIENPIYTPSSGDINEGTVLLTVNATGCGNASGQIDLVIIPLPPSPVLSIQPPFFCVSSPPLALTEGTPLGGTFSGTGVSYGVFSPAVAGAGNHNITYTISDTYGCESSATNTITVFQSYPPDPICIVTLDSLSAKNKIIWKKTLVNSFTNYVIFKLSGTEYIPIDTVPYNSVSEYIDNSSQPHNHTDKYKIAALDTCGILTNLSPFHETMLLQTSIGSGNYILSWNKYIDESGSFIPDWYYLYKGTFLNNMELFDSISGGLSTISYIDNESNLYYYQIAVFKPNPCNSSKNVFQKSVSNICNNQSIGINDLNVELRLVIYPNPANDNIIVEIPDITKYKNIMVCDIQGRLLLQQAVLISKHHINISFLAKGMYFIRLEGEESSSVLGRFVKK